MEWLSYYGSTYPWIILARQEFDIKEPEEGNMNDNNWYVLNKLIRCHVKLLLL